MDQQTLITIIVLLVAAFVPSLVYLFWVRNTEKHGKLSWNKLTVTFTWGAVFAVIMAVILSFIFIEVLSVESIQREYAPLQKLQDPTIMTLVVVCVVAPIVEEFTKVLGVFSVKGSIIEIEDGLVFGAAVGLGFAATENLLYESTAYFQQGFEAFIAVVLVRSIASTLLHGSASAVAGFGISKSITKGTHSFLPYYLVAVVMHGSFNYLASASLLYTGDIPLLALLLALVFSITAFKLVRGKITELDKDFSYYR
ncbi:MAG: PrsW family intramembrane metalloprotease [Thermoplasmatota archaeon]